MSTRLGQDLLSEEISLVKHDLVACALAQLLTKEYLSSGELYRKVDKCLPEHIDKETFAKKLSLISRKGLAIKVFVKDGSDAYTTTPLGRKILPFVGQSNGHLKQSHAKICQSLKTR